MSAVRLRPFFPFYGGKWRDTPRLYPAPEHPTIVEPFAGSAGYSVRYFDRDVVLCEADPVIAGVWTYLIHVSAKEILELPDVEPGQKTVDLKVPEEARNLIGFWLNRAVSRPARSASKWMRDPAHANSFWGERVRNTIATQVDLIRHWRICAHSYDLLPNRAATWFIDPPYEAAGKHYVFGSSTINYSRLSEWCRSRQGQVIVCEGEGAQWLPFVPLAQTKTTRRDKRSREVVWVSNSLPSETGFTGV